MKLISKAVMIGMSLFMSAPLTFGQCRVCQEWQGGWLSVTKSSRIKCLVDGDTCTMNLTSGCGVRASGSECPKSLPKGSLRLASTTARPDARLFFIMGSAVDPLALEEVVFQAGTTKLGVKQGKLQNTTQNAVARYQLAFAVVDRSTWKATIVPGPIIDSTVPIKPKEERALIPPILRDFLGETDFSAVGVFVREARFSDGSVWAADLARIKAEVENATTDVKSSGKSTS